MRRAAIIAFISVLASALTIVAPAFTAQVAAFATRPGPAPWDPNRGLLIEGATVVTMDDRHTVIPHGSVLIRAGRIVAVWSGPRPPAGVEIGEASVVHAGPQDLLYPGLINLHSHPEDNVLPTWLPPSSHAIPQQQPDPAGLDRRGAVESSVDDPGGGDRLDDPSAVSRVAYPAQADHGSHGSAGDLTRGGVSDR